MKTFDELFERVRHCSPKQIVVAGAQDREVLAAVDEANRKGLARAILVGDLGKIKELARELQIDLRAHEFCHEPDLAMAAKRAVALVHSGKGDMLVKGLVSTAALLKAVLDKTTGLRTGRVLSQVAAFEVPWEKRIMLLTDAGMNINPTFEQKIDIIKNAVAVARSLAISQPKVAVISGIETVNPAMASSVDAALLAKMGERGQIRDCLIDGPLPLDVAVSFQAAQAKGVVSPVAGQADILVMPDLDAGNVFYKSMAFLARARIASIVAGAMAPIALPSRADSHDCKLASIALGVLVAAEAREEESPVKIEYLNPPQAV